jgi:hypothetical protein
MIELVLQELGTIEAGQIRPGMVVAVGDDAWDTEQSRREVDAVHFWSAQEVELVFKGGLTRTFAQLLKLDRSERVPTQTTPASRAIGRIEQAIASEKQEAAKFRDAEEYGSAAKAKGRKAGLTIALRIVQEEITIEEAASVAELVTDDAEAMS